METDHSHEEKQREIKTGTKGPGDEVRTKVAKLFGADPGISFEEARRRPHVLGSEKAATKDWRVEKAGPRNHTVYEYKKTNGARIMICTGREADCLLISAAPRMQRAIRNYLDHVNTDEMTDAEKTRVAELVSATMLARGEGPQ